nr:pilus assembly protein [uncultured Celeribacter sp.]
MKLFEMIKTFSRKDDGAVTVDWVVLTAAVVGLGIAVLATVSNSTTGLGDDISTAIGSVSPADEEPVQDEGQS